MALKLSVERWGRGATPALLLHGFTGSRHSFDLLAPSLADVLDARCVDLPGHHGAPLPASTGEAGFLETVDALAALLDVPTAVVGYSQGARLALALAVRHPRKVSRLVLESGSPGLHRRRERVVRRASDEALAQELLASGLEAFIDRWEQQPIFSGLRALSEPDRLGLRARRLAHTAEGLAGALRTLGQGAQTDLWPSLPTLRVPTLLVTGARDEKYTHLARRMAAELPLAWRVALPGVGHAPHLECRAGYAREVSAFLAARWTHEAHPLEEISA